MLVARVRLDLVLLNSQVTGFTRPTTPCFPRCAISATQTQRDSPRRGRPRTSRCRGRVTTCHEASRTTAGRVLQNFRDRPTKADEIEGIGIKLALYIYMSGVDPETADSAVEQVLSAYKDCVQVLGRDLLAEVKGLMPAWQQGM